MNGILKWVLRILLCAAVSFVAVMAVNLGMAYALVNLSDTRSTILMFTLNVAAIVIPFVLLVRFFRKRDRKSAQDANER